MYDFGLSEEQFWRLTPAKFFYLSRRHEAEQELRDFRMAYIISTMCNINRGKRTRSYKPQDFMPTKLAERKKPKTMKELKAQFMSALGHRMKDDK